MTDAPHSNPTRSKDHELGTAVNDLLKQSGPRRAHPTWGRGKVLRIAAPSTARPDPPDTPECPSSARMPNLLDYWTDLPALITVQEAADCLGISRSAAYRAAERGELPVIRLGGRMRVPVARLMVLVGLLQAPPANPNGRGQGSKTPMDPADVS